MKGVTRSIGFRKAEVHLASTSAVTCGFVPMQGRGRASGDLLRVPGPSQGLSCCGSKTARLPGRRALDVLAGEPAAAWSGLTVPAMTPWDDVYLWLAGFQPG